MSILMLAVGLHTSAKALTAATQQHGLMWRAMLVLLVGVPVLALVTVIVLPLDNDVRAALALMAACPGAPLVLREYRDRPIAIAIIALVSLVAPLLLVAWIAVFDRVLGTHLSVDTTTLAAISLKQLVPLGVGVAIASIWPHFAERAARIVWDVFLVLLVVAIAIVLARGARALLTASPWTIVAVFVITTGSALMGHVAGRRDPVNRHMIASIAVLGNPALGIAVMTSTYAGYRPTAMLAAYLLVRALAEVPYSLWARHEEWPLHHRPA